MSYFTALITHPALECSHTTTLNIVYSAKTAETESGLHQHLWYTARTYSSYYVAVSVFDCVLPVLY